MSRCRSRARRRSRGMDATGRAAPPKIHIALLMDWQRTCASAVRGHESMVTVLEQVARTCSARLHKVSGAEIADGFLTQWRPALLVLGGGRQSWYMGALGEKGRQRVRDFVGGGGGYLGVCAGAAVACAGHTADTHMPTLPRLALCADVTPVRFVSRAVMTELCALRLEQPAAADVGRVEGASVLTRYRNGPGLAYGSAAQPGVRRVASFASDLYSPNESRPANPRMGGVAAIIASEGTDARKGRVCCVSPHLEDGEPAARRLLVSCALWTCREQPMPLSSERETLRSRKRWLLERKPLYGSWERARDTNAAEVDALCLAAREAEAEPSDEEIVPKKQRPSKTARGPEAISWDQVYLEVDEKDGGAPEAEPEARDESGERKAEARLATVTSVPQVEAERPARGEVEKEATLYAEATDQSRKAKAAHSPERPLHKFSDPTSEVRVVRLKIDEVKKVAVEAEAAVTETDAPRLAEAVTEAPRIPEAVAEAPRAAETESEAPSSARQRADLPAAADGADTEARRAAEGARRVAEEARRVAAEVAATDVRRRATRPTRARIDHGANDVQRRARISADAKVVVKKTAATEARSYAKTRAESELNTQAELAAAAKAAEQAVARKAAEEEAARRQKVLAEQTELARLALAAASAERDRIAAAEAAAERERLDEERERAKQAEAEEARVQEVRRQEEASAQEARAQEARSQEQARAQETRALEARRQQEAEAACAAAAAQRAEQERLERKRVETEAARDAAAREAERKPAAEKEACAAARAEAYVEAEKARLVAFRKVEAERMASTEARAKARAEAKKLRLAVEDERSAAERRHQTLTAVEGGCEARTSNGKASTEIFSSAVSCARSDQSADILVARKVQRILCAFEDEGRSLESAFRFFDCDDDGLLSAGEFHRGLTDLGAESLRCLSRAQVEVLIAEEFPCGGTFKDFSEFARRGRLRLRLKRATVATTTPAAAAAAARCLQKILISFEDKGHDLADAFRWFDTHGSGRLSARDIHCGLAGLLSLDGQVHTLADVEELMSTHFGVGAGGFVDVEGFTSFACRGRAAPLYKPALAIGNERQPPAVRVS